METEVRSWTNGTDERDDDGSSVGTLPRETPSEGKGSVQERVVAGTDAGIDKAAEGLGSAAEKMRSRAEEADGVRSSIEAKTADAMDKTAGYLKDHDSSELMHDVEQFVKTHPLQAAVGALAAGYLLGKIAR